MCNIKINKQSMNKRKIDSVTFHLNRRMIIRLIFLVVMINYFIPGFSQDSTIVTGFVVSGSNKPLKDVAVSIQGSENLPVITQEDGKFTVTVNSLDAILNITPTEKYKPTTVNLNGRSDLKIFLSSVDVNSGEDPINIMGLNYTRGEMVSAQQELSISNLDQTAVVSIDQFLNGKMAGVYSRRQSGDPSSFVSMSLRGISSINSSNQPIYIVDGIPIIPYNVFSSNIEGNYYNPLLPINPFNISSVHLIKDGPALAAYGSKASGGMILINTLNPSATETVIDIDFNSGLSMAPERYIPQLNAFQHKTLIHEMLYSSGLQEELVYENYQSLFYSPDDDEYINYQHNTNWQNQIFRNASFNNFNIEVKGGDHIARYGLSFGHQNHNGIIDATSYKAYNLSFVSELNIFRWLKMNGGISLGHNNKALKESAKVYQTSPILTSLAKSPMINPYRYDENKNEISELTAVDELGVSNPSAVVQNYLASNKNYMMVLSLGLESQLGKYSSAHTKFGITHNNLKELIFMPNQGMEYYFNQEAYNVSTASNNHLNSFFNNTYINFTRELNIHHKIKNSAGLNLQTNKYQFDWGLTKNAHENDEYRNLQDGTNILREMGGNNRDWNWLSFYNNFVYSYRDKYLFQGSLSLDGSSRIGENAANTIKIGNYPYGLFYSAGIGWKLSQEPLLKNLAWLTELKIRASYGKVGNDNIGELNSKQYYRSVKYSQTMGIYPAVLFNNELSYEISTKRNAGMDLFMLANRFGVVFDYFKSSTSDMLIFVPVESYLGFYVRPENNGKLENKGYEISGFFRLIDLPSFKWDFEPFYATVENRITQIKGNKLVTPITGGEIVNMVGETANSFYGYRFLGVFPTTEAAMEANLVNNRGIPYGAGDAIYEDISGPNGQPDGVINEHDKTIIGSSLPRLRAGFTNTFNFKNWQLSFTLNYTSGHDLFNYVRYKNESLSNLDNQNKIVLTRWQYEGQQTMVPRANMGDPVGNSVFSSRWIEDGSYLRVNHLSLSYTIPRNFLVFRNATAYIAVNNLYTFSNYLGYDPEFAYSDMSLENGADYGLMPQPRQYLIGIKIGL
jgi:TonB-linked SusC/RagA family outer membrane protein